MNIIENLKDLIIYQSQCNENISVEVLYNSEDFWLTQKSMSKLFDVEVNTINYHLKEIFETHELEENRTIRKIRTVQKEGNRQVERERAFYNLDAIISVGYRVNSINATAFRRWATRVLNNYLLKGYSVNQQLLAMQRQFDSRLEEHSLRMTRIEDKQAEQQEQLDFFIRTSTPPAEMVFFEGDFYTARVALENLVSSANHRVIVIDAYVSA